MKLLNKLLPIFAVGSAAAIVTPLTACTGNAASYNALDDVDTSGWEQYDKSEIDIDSTVDEFASVVKEDPSIFEKDVIWGRNKICESVSSNSSITVETEIESFNYTLSNLKLEQINGQNCWSFNSSITFIMKAEATSNAAPAADDINATINVKANVDIRRMALIPTLVEYPGMIGEQSRLYFQFEYFTNATSESTKTYFNLIPDAHHYTNIDIEMKECDAETGELIQKAFSQYYIINDKDNIVYQSDGPLPGNASYISVADIIRWPSYYFSETTITTD